MEESLLGRMLPYIGAATATIAGGLLDGLCCAIEGARHDGSISITERSELLQLVDYYVQQHDCGFVCVHLTPDRTLWHRDPDTRVLAAERWRTWATHLVRDAQRELYGY